MSAFSVLRRTVWGMRLLSRALVVGFPVFLLFGPAAWVLLPGERLWVLPPILGLCLGLGLLVAGRSKDVLSERHWDWEKMTGLNTNHLLQPLPKVEVWQEGAFVDLGVSSEAFLDVPAYCVNVLDGRSSAELLAALQSRFACSARQWDVLPGPRLLAVFDSPPPSAGPVAQQGARLWARLDAVPAGTRARFVLASGGEGLDRREDDGADDQGTFGAGYLAELESAEGGAAAWFVELADFFFLPGARAATETRALAAAGDAALAEAVQQLRPLRLLAMFGVFVVFFAFLLGVSFLLA